MDDDTVTFDSKIRKIGNSYYILLPPELRKYLSLRDGKNVEIQPENGQYGKYVSLWNPDIQNTTTEQADGGI